MKNNDIQDLLKKIVNPLQPNDSMVCIVRELNNSTKTITVEPINIHDFSEGTPNIDNYIYEVKLSAFQPVEIDTFGYLIVPKIGSYVIVSPKENSDWFVSMFSQIELFQVYNESNMSISMNDSALTLMSDDIVLTSYTEDKIQGIVSNYTEKYISIFGKDMDYQVTNDKGQFKLDPTGNIKVNNTKGGVDISDAGKIAIYNTTTSIKKDILDKLQSIVQSLDIGLTALGGADPTRTANIALLLTSIGLLFED